MAQICIARTIQKPEEELATCETLQVVQERVGLPTMQSTLGGAFKLRKYSPDQLGYVGSVIVNNTFGSPTTPGGGALKAVTAIAAGVAAAGAWKDEIKAAGRYVGEKLAEAANYADECWDALWN